MNSRYTIIIFILLSLLSQPVSGQRWFRVAHYNMENVFDTIHDAGKTDEGFLPASEREWDSRKYRTKLANLARVIAGMGKTQPVDVIGVCEVENDSVLRDLTERTMLRRLGYKYIATSSNDVRGIDVGLLYQPERFLPLSVDTISVPYDSIERPTRDILHVCGMAASGDTLHIFVNHWPSRRGGKLVTQDYRMRAARTIMQFLDSLFVSDPDAKIILVGDFNDEYRDNSIRHGLRARAGFDYKGEADPRGLYVLTARKKGRNGIKGTYKYRGRWNQLDQIIVSGNLLQGRGLRTSYDDCRIVDDIPFLLEKDKNGKSVKPRHTYYGTYYRGGTSDHLPVIAVFHY